MQVHREVHILQSSLQHRDGVRLVVVRVDALLRQHAGNILEQSVQLQLTLLIRDLQIAASALSSLYTKCVSTTWLDADCILL